MKLFWLLHYRKIKRQLTSFQPHCSSRGQKNPQHTQQERGGFKTSKQGVPPSSLSGASVGVSHCSGILSAAPFPAVPAAGLTPLCSAAKNNSWNVSWVLSELCPRLWEALALPCSPQQRSEQADRTSLTLTETPAYPRGFPGALSSF